MCLTNESFYAFSIAETVKKRLRSTVFLTAASSIVINFVYLRMVCICTI